MFEKVKELRNKYSSTNDEAVRAEVNREMKALQNSDPEAYEEALLECLKDSTREAKELRVRQQMESVLPAISISYIAKEYFHKSKEWFYQRLNGNVVNGKPAEFTNDELNTLSFALKDISKKISAVSIH